uniref:Cation/H+ exchanger domain-containing protein n=1 Tax=Entomoneis paludosa TaxID=265537 RepID=A0A7S2Y4E6_9STRA|mmetsp:Transcript_15921/g.32909  ORF Transcript_15921/g.32909 Transcript_15921/m.32909 type:complete len:738 (+) Transcript_15921:2-2215(+)
MNDGSAIVFYTIFSKRYLLELGVPGLGEDVDWGQGFKLFFQMSLGGAAIGIAFGFATLIFMHYMKRRLDQEENVVEVSLSLAAAYLCYFTADFVWSTSGVIATLSMGLVMNEYGRPSINDLKLMKGVWSIVEHVLNTILFTLGGLVWGSVISNADQSTHATFTAKDWGYLVVLYILLHVIRFALFALFYPATSRLGLKTNVTEQSFQIFGGLRGAVGIALAIAIDNTVQQATEQLRLDEKFIEQTSKLFGYVGGMAFLTLSINATLAGPLLRKLGLADMTSFRKNILGVVGSRLRMTAVDKMVALLAKPWFSKIDYSIVQKHVSVLKDVYMHEVVASAKRYENVNHHRSWYSVPRLGVVVPHLQVDPLKSHMTAAEGKQMLNDLKKPRDGRRIRQNTHHSLFDESVAGTDSYRPKPRRVRQSTHEGVFSSDPNMRSSDKASGPKPGRTRPLTHLGALFGGSSNREENTDPYTLEESRRLFLEVLRAEYDRLIDNGNLARREDLNYVLLTSVDFCADSVNNGGKLNDWEFVKKFRGMGLSWKNLSNARVLKLILKSNKKTEEARATAKEISVRFEVNLAIAFLEAHTRARRVYSEEFAEVQGDLSAAEAQVIKESEEQCQVAELFLTSLPEDKVKVYVSHIFSIILLNKLVKQVEELANASFLKDTEAEEFLEHIQKELFETEHCVSQYYRDRRRSTFRGTFGGGGGGVVPATDMIDEEQPPTNDDTAEKTDPDIVET